MPTLPVAPVALGNTKKTFAVSMDTGVASVPQTKVLSAFAVNCMYRPPAQEKSPDAVLESPPPTVAELPDAVLESPPPTVARGPDAVLESPPPTVAGVPDAVLDNPPPTVALEISDVVVPVVLLTPKFTCVLAPLPNTELPLRLSAPPMVIVPVEVMADAVIEPALSTLKLPALTVNEPIFNVVSVMPSVSDMSLPVIELSTIVELLTEFALGVPDDPDIPVKPEPSPTNPVAVTVPITTNAVEGVVVPMPTLLVEKSP